MSLAVYSQQYLCALKKIVTTPCGPLWLPSINASWAVSEFFRHSWAPGGCKINVWGYTEILPFYDE